MKAQIRRSLRPRFRRAVWCAVALLVTSFASPLAAQAQQSGAGAAALRQEIERLDALLSDPGRTDEGRRQIERMIVARKRQLSEMRVVDLEHILEQTRDILTPEEVRSLEAEIAEAKGRVDEMPRPNPAPRRDGADVQQASLRPIVPAAPRATGATRLAPAPTAAVAPPRNGSDCFPDASEDLKKYVHEVAKNIVEAEHDTSRGTPDERFQELFGPIVFEAMASSVGLKEAELSSLARQEAKAVGEAVIEVGRDDKQIGASARTDGTTTVAEKPGFANLLGFAIENGAVQQNVQGTTLTLSATPYSLVALDQGDTAETYRRYTWLAAIGATASFELDDANDPLASVTRGHLNEWTVRIRLTPDNSARSERAEKIFNTYVLDELQVGNVIAGELRDSFRGKAGAAQKALVEKYAPTAAPVGGVVEAALADTKAANSETERVAQIESQLLCELAKDIREPIRNKTFFVEVESLERIRTETIPALVRAKLRQEEAIKGFEKALEELGKRPEVTFAYTNHRDPLGSDYSNLRLLYQQTLAGSIKLVANGGFSLYSDPDPFKNQNTLRDFAVSASLEGVLKRRIPLVVGEDLNLSPITYTLAGRYQRLFENRNIAGRTADIGSVQFKLEIPVGAGMSIPLSVTYATATDLVKENHVRGNFGFTFDVDKLFFLKKIVGH